MFETLTETSPGLEPQPVATMEVPAPSAELSIESAPDRFDLNQLSGGEGLPETSRGYDGLPALETESNWDLNQFNNLYSQPSSVEQSTDFLPPEGLAEASAKPVEGLAPEDQIIDVEFFVTPETSPLDFEPDAIDRAVALVRTETLNPPLEDLVMSLESQQLSLSPVEAEELATLEAAETTAIGRYRGFLEFQQNATSLLIDEAAELTASSSPAEQAPRRSGHEIASPKPVSENSAAAAIADSESLQPIPLIETATESQAQSAFNPEIIHQTIIDYELPIDEQTEELIGQYITQPEIRLAQTQLSREKIDRLSLPEQKERLRLFSLTSEVSSTLEPAEQFEQHFKELIRLLLSLMSAGGEIVNYEDERARFDYQGEISDLNELVATIKDQAVITKIAELLEHHHDDLIGFKEAVEDELGSDYEQLIVDLDPANAQLESTSWLTGLSTIEIEHTINEAGGKTLQISFPARKGATDAQPTHLNLPTRALPEKTGKETRLTTRFTAS